MNAPRPGPYLQPPHPTFGELEAVSNMVRTPMSNGGWLIADVPIDQPNCVALARLFAAAPQLARALEHALAWIEGESPLPAWAVDAQAALSAVNAPTKGSLAGITRELDQCMCGSASLISGSAT